MDQHQPVNVSAEHVIDALKRQLASVSYELAIMTARAEQAEQRLAASEGAGVPMPDQPSGQ